MIKQRRAKLFLNGRSQAVRLPMEFRFAGKEVYIRRDDATGDVILSERLDDKDFWKRFFAEPPDPEAKDFLADRKKSLARDVKL